MTEYGSGIALTRGLDFEISDTGDLQMEGGPSELEKDIAFNLINELQDIPGNQKTPRLQAIVKNRTRRILLSDSRVDNVIGDIEIFYGGEREEILEVSATVSSVDGEVDLIIPVGGRIFTSA